MGGWITHTGYAQIKFKEKLEYGHRVSYLIHKGEIPEDKMVCHTCDVRCCVNPDHLFLGTHKENMNDRNKKNRSAKKLTKEDVLSIRELRQSNTLKFLTEKFGVSEATIIGVSKRKSWKHI